MTARDDPRDAAMPCPWCGFMPTVRDDIATITNPGFDGACYVACRTGCARGPYGMGYAEVIEKWNRGCRRAERGAECPVFVQIAASEQGNRLGSPGLWALDAGGRVWQYVFASELGSYWEPLVMKERP